MYEGSTLLHDFRFKCNLELTEALVGHALKTDGPFPRKPVFLKLFHTKTAFFFSQRTAQIKRYFRKVLILFSCVALLSETKRKEYKYCPRRVPMMRRVLHLRNVRKKEEEM